MTRRTTAADLARTHAIEAATYPPRITNALHQLDLAADPYRRGDGGPGPINGISDPAGNAVTDPSYLAHIARDDRKRLIRAVIDMDRQGATIAAILATWAPAQAKPLWCQNHQRYGRNEPRSEDGSRNCRWCCDVQRDYGHWPTPDLIRMRAEGRRISDTEYRRALGVQSA